MRLGILSLVFLYTIRLSAQFVDVTASKNFTTGYSSPFFGNGVAAVDYDNDGDIDLYVCSGENSPDQLYANDDGTFEPVGEPVGLGSIARSRMALWFDIDGDRDLDLLVGGDCHLDMDDCDDESHIRLYRQENGTFSEITNSSGLSTYGPKTRMQRLGGLAAADINGDGFLDFIQVFSNHSIEAFINNGNGTFTEQSEQLDLDVGDYYYWQPFFHDFDSDGYIDLYCNIDFESNQFFLNTHEGFFEDRSKSSNSDNAFNEMGITLGDIDNDGDFDIYSTNSENYLGNDVYNILLKRDESSNSSVYFTEVARSLGVERGGWGWGATFLDYNNDGLIDLAATNGWYSEDPDQSKFWTQSPDQSFMDESELLGFADMLNAVALISLDYDRDGDLDMIQSLKGYEGLEVPIRLLENRTPSTDVGHYLLVKPRMDGPNHFSIGATVVAYVDGIPFARIIHAGTSFYGQEPAEAFIGVGQALTIDSLSITWPGGESSWWYDIAVDQTLELNDEGVVHRPVQLRANQLAQDVEITWKDVSKNETKFLLQRSTTEDFSSYQEIELVQNSTNYLDTEVPNVPQVYYRLMAVNQQTSSRFTAIVAATYTVLSNSSFLSGSKIYPNPASSFVTLETIGSPNQIQMYTISGARIPMAARTNSVDGKVTIDLNGLDAGIYLLQVNDQALRLMIK